MTITDEIVAALDWDGDQALRVVALLEDITRAIWDAYGSDMAHQLEFDFPGPEQDR